MAKTVVGLFQDMTAAQSVLRALTQAGFPREDISLVAGDTTGEYTRACEAAGNKAGEGAGVGGAIGAAVGGAGGLLVGLGALAIPGLGPIVALGPILATLVGLGAGAAAGGVIGALVGSGIPEQDAACYAEGIRRGGVLVSVSAADERADAAADIMRRFRPLNIEERAAAWRAEGWKGPMPTGATAEGMGTTARERVRGAAEDVGAAAAGAASTVAGAAQDVAGKGAEITGAQPTAPGKRAEMRAERPAGAAERAKMAAEGRETIPIVKEELQVGKRTAQEGGVRVHSQTITRPVEEQVTLRQERVDVERRTADRPLTGADLDEAFKERTFEVRAESEEPVVQKTARVVGEVEVTKGVETAEQTVRGEVRETEVDVERLGGDMTRGAAMGADIDITTMRPDWERHYRSNQATYGRTFDDYMPAYRYGYMLSRDTRYRDRDWRGLESMAREQWMRDRPGYGTWDQVKDAVQHGWNSARASTRT